MPDFDPNAPYDAAAPAATPKPAAFNPNQPYNAAPAAAPVAFNPNAAYGQAPAAPARFDPNAAYSATPQPQPMPGQPKPQPQGWAGKLWDWANESLVSPEHVNEALGIMGVGTPDWIQKQMDKKAEELPAGRFRDAYNMSRDIQRGRDQFISENITPLNIAMLFGPGLIEKAVVKAGVPALKAAAAVRKVNLLVNAGFLAKYGFQLGETKDQLETAWNDIKAAPTEKQRSAALDRFTNLATQTVLNATATGLAVKGLGHSIDEFRSASPKGNAMQQTDYAQAVHGLSSDRRVSVGQAEQLERELNKLVPGEDRQAAIYHNMEAQGDVQLLERRALQADAANNPDLAAEIRAGKNLSPEEIKFRTRAEQILSDNGRELKAVGKLPPAADSAGYVPHRYAHDYVDPVTKKPVPALPGSEGFLRERTFDNIVDAELAGLDPIKKLSAVVADYHENAGNVLARDRFVSRLAAGRDNEGAPLVAPQALRRGGVMMPDDTEIDPAHVQQLQQAGTLNQLIADGKIVVDPQTNVHYWHQEHFEPSGEPYTKTGLNMYTPDNKLVPLALSPEIAAHAKALLEPATPGKLAKLALKASGVAKTSLLSLSPFHWATVSNRMFEMMKNPFSRGDIDWFNLTPIQSEALQNGVNVGSRSELGRAGEGITARGPIIDRIPIVGDLNKLIDTKLFGSSGYMSKLKFNSYETLKNEILKSRPALTNEQAGRIAASQVNNKFGGLNYEVLGRGANDQNTLRLFLLAPDFLESTGRSVLDVAGPYGKGLVKRLVAYNVANWLVVRGLNYLFTGNTHPEAGYSVRLKGRDYTWRTTLGDFLHFAAKPLDFAMNRVNPLLVRSTIEDVYGIDQQGHRVTPEQKVFDTIRNITPIPTHGIFPTQQVTQRSPADELLQSIGLGSRKYFTPAETLAHQLASKREEGAPLEGEQLQKAQTRFRLEDALRTAINNRDTHGQAAALNSIHKATAEPGASMTRQQGEKLIKDARAYPSTLQSAVNRLSLEDAFQVWDKASLVERRAMREILRTKIDRWNKAAAEHTREQNQTMRERIRAFHFSLTQ